MKKTKLILGLVALTAITGGIYMNNNVESLSERTYSSKDLSNGRTKHQSWTEANEYLNSLYVNPITGMVEPADYDAAHQHALSMNNAKANSFTFVDDGPDNVGGRTRAIIVDVNDNFIVYAGSVDGGVFKSTDAGNNWSRLEGWESAGTGTMSISSICMTKDGTLYVGTGGGSLLGEGSLGFEGSGMQDGNGIWYSTNGGDSFTQLTGTQNLEISRVSADTTQADVFYFTGQSQSLKKVVNKGTPINLATTTDIQSSLSTVNVDVSPDGQVIIVTGGTRVYVSSDGGTTFKNCVGNGSVTSPIANGGNRKECATSYDLNDNGYYNLFVAEESGGQMRAVWYSEDHGENWYKIGPASTTGWTPCISAAGQCYYDMVIDGIPGEPYHCIFGGIDLYRWQKTPGTNAYDADGQWEPISNWAYGQQNPRYVHSDNHRFTWDGNGALYIGNDGGLSKSFDNTTQFFTTINKGYNVTQFYGIGYGPNDETIGGAQDNGTKYNDHTSASGKSFTSVNGGDGFECEISFLSDGEALLSTIYSGSLSRSDDKGGNWQPASAPGAGSGFYNAVRLFEDDNDTDTKDSIEFIPSQSMSIGDTVNYFSETFSLPLSYILTQNLTVTWSSVTPLQDSILPNFDTIPAGVPYYYNPIAQDTIRVPDPKQSLCVTYGNSVYVTRDMMRFAQSIEWWDLGLASSGHSYEFSKDGNVLWVGTSGGSLIRVSGLDSAYSKQAADVTYRPVSGDTIINTATLAEVTNGFTTLNYTADNYVYKDGTPVTYKLWTKTIVSGGNIITDISTSAMDLDRVMYTTGSSAGSVYISTNANAISPTFTDKGGNLPNYPVFGCEFIMNTNNDDIILVGTEFGAYSTDNPTSGSPTWTAHTGETGIIPVYDVRQQWRNFNQGAKFPYQVYLGTHARGIWKSGSYLSVADNTDVIEDVKDVSGIKVFPNPLSSNGNIAFELGARTDVEFKVYDLQGKIVNQVTWNQMEAGKHTRNFSVEALPAGTYLVTLKAGSTTEVSKFIKF